MRIVMNQTVPVTLSSLIALVLVLMACSPVATPTPSPVFDKVEVENRIANDMYLCPVYLKKANGEAYSQQQANKYHQFQARYIGRDEWLVEASWSNPAGYHGEWKFNERTGITSQYDGTDWGSPLEYCIALGRISKVIP